MTDAAPPANAHEPALEDYPPEEWERRLVEMLDGVATRHPKAADVVASMADNALFRALLRLNARAWRGGELGGGDPFGSRPARFDESFRSILDLARETPIGDGEALDAVAILGLLGEEEFEAMIPPAPRRDEKLLGRIVGCGLALAVVGAAGYAVWRLVAKVGLAKLKALAGAAAVAIPILAALGFVGDRSYRAYFPKAAYSDALSRLAELGCRVPSQVTLTLVYTGLAAFGLGALTGVALWAALLPWWGGLTAGVAASVASRPFFFPRPAEFRDWALREIAARGGLFPRD